jgi:hypothetical protein
VNHGLALAVKSLASRDLASAPRCVCGSPSVAPGTLCAACVATHPQMPQALQLSTLAATIVEAERALELSIRSVNSQAAVLATLRKLYDQLAISERRP